MHDRRWKWRPSKKRPGRSQQGVEMKVLMPSPRVRGALMAGAATVALLAGGRAHAQASGAAASQDATTVGELVVTATKREERLRDVPVAASVISSDIIEKRGIVADPGQLLQANPGVRFNNPGSPETSELSIRGSGTARATSADSGVGLYRNGMYIGGGLQFGRTFFRADLFDLQRAEVLRGTLGALYGRNAVGGAINMISAQPVFAHTGWALVDYNPDRSATTIQAVENVPINDNWAVRFGIDSVNQYKGVFFNPVFNRYVDQYHGYVARGQVRYRNGPLDATLLVERQELLIPPVPFQITIAPSAQFPKGYSSPQYILNWDIPGQADLDAKDVIFNGSYEFNWAQLAVTAGYRDRSGDSYTDNDGFSVASLAAARAAGNPAANIDNNANQVAIDHTQIYYGEAHLSGQVEKLRWLIGGDWLRETSNFRLDRERTPTKANSSIGSSGFTTQIWTSGAVYGSVGYDVTDALNVTAELRYTKDRKRASAYGLDLGTQLPNTTPILRDGRFPNTSYNLIATYHVTPSVMTYAKVGTGYRVGGFNAANGDPRQPIPVPFSYGDEKSTTYEVGAKGNLTRQVFLSFAAYHTKVDGVLTQETNGCALGDAVCPVQPTNFVTNAGSGLVDGIELEANAVYHIAGGDFTFSGGASRQYGKFTGGPLKGIRVPQTPNWLANANLDFEHPLVGGASWFANVNYTGQWGGLQDVTLPPFHIDDRQLLDLRGGVRKDHLEVAAYVKNATDEVYAIFRLASNVRWPDDRRSYGFQIRYHW